MFESKLLAMTLMTLLALAAPTDAGRQFLAERLKAPADPLAYYDRLREAERLYGAQQFAAAATAFHQVVADYPVDGNSWIALGQALRQSGKPKEAIAAYEKGLQLTSALQPHFIYLSMAQAQLAAGEKEGAYRSLERMIAEGEFTQRPALFDLPAFAPLRDEPRFRKLVGRLDTAGMSRTEGWRADLDFLVAEVKRVNAVYRVQPLPPSFMTIYHELKRDVPKLTDDELFVGMGRMLATLHQGHTSLFDGGKVEFTGLPMQVYAFPEGIFLIDADEPYRGLIGDEVVRIEQSPAAEVLRKVEEHKSVESEMEILWNGMEPLTILQVLRGLGIVPKERDAIRLTLRAPDGRTSEQTIPTVPFKRRRKLKPPPGVPAPLFLRNVPRAHWFEALPQENAVYVQVNQIAPDPDETLPQFGLRLRKFLAETPTKHVILDLRHNNGGNTAIYPELLRTLIAHTTKEGNRLYVIIGRGLYSATANLITDLERLADPIFVGEPSSATGNQHGDESATVLPYGGVQALLTSVRWQLSHPWDRRRSIVPQIPVQLTAKAYFAGQDPALDTILTLIRRDRQ
jgi:tetratricopeptide (TPR) repeat protein